MLKRLDQAAAVIVSLVGLVHLLVGREAFLTPSERGVWFVSAGFLMLTTGLANLSCASVRPTRLQSLTGMSGALAVLILGGLLAVADPRLLLAPQTLVVFALGGFLSLRRLGELSRR
jgi:hypothetical protein